MTTLEQNSQQIQKLVNGFRISSKNDESFYTLIICGNGGTDGFGTVYVPLDYVSSVSSSYSSDVTSYPLLNGDILMDHKYDRPGRVTISGAFSENGKFSNVNFWSSDKSSRLRNIQEFFLWVRKRGIKIKLLFGFRSQRMFTEIEDLILTDISFTMQLNSMQFTLSLTEVYYFESQEDIQYVELRDPDAPYYGSFKTLSFSEDVLGAGDSSYLEQVVINELNAAGCMDLSFMNGLLTTTGIALLTSVMTTTGKTFMLTLSQNIAKAVIEKLCKSLLVKIIQAVVTTVAKLTGKAAVDVAAKVAGAIPVVGTVILVTSIVIDGLLLFRRIIKRWKARHLYVTFKNYSDDKKARHEDEKFVKLMINVRKYTNSITQELGIKMYGFSTNQPMQELYMIIGSTCYQFNVEKRSENSRWSCKVTDVQTDEEVITKNLTEMTGNKNVLDLKEREAEFETDDGYHVYLINNGLIFQDYSDEDLGKVLDDAWKSGDCGYLGYTEEEMEEGKENPPTTDLITRFKDDGVYKDLTKFQFVVTPPNVSFKTVKKKFEKNLTNCFLKEAYE